MYLDGYFWADSTVGDSSQDRWIAPTGILLSVYGRIGLTALVEFAGPLGGITPNSKRLVERLPNLRRDDLVKRLGSHTHRVNRGRNSPHVANRGPNYATPNVASDMRYVRFEKQASLLDKHPVSDGKGGDVSLGIVFGVLSFQGNGGGRSEQSGHPNPRKRERRPPNYLPR